MHVTTPVRVRYAETDQMGIVYYSNYLVWFEIGRVELLRSLGLTYSQMEIEDRCILPVVEANCRYRAPARYDDEILIETRPMMMRQSVIKFGYRILRKDPNGAEPTLLAEGETVHVACDEQFNKIEMPERYAAGLKALIEKA
jgi:acyl-CoA thioester hydrolase